jgi:hypothetical protein
MTTIAFHSNQLGLRGTEVSLYDYAKFNETILNNRSIIVAPANGAHHPASVHKFLSRFPVQFYRSREHLDEILKLAEVHLLYAMKAGQDDGLVAANIPTAVHAVFRAKEPHGDVYAYISEWLSMHLSDGTIPFVPYIVHLPQGGGDMRGALGISKEDHVIGYMGGESSFDIPFAVDEVARFASARNPKIRFIFLNTRLQSQNWLTSKRLRYAIARKTLIYLDGTASMTDKAKFVETCNVMLHARVRGESFGLAIGEFSLRGKPVLTYNGPNIRDRAHLDMLGQSGNYYSSRTELRDLLQQPLSSLQICKMYEEKFDPVSVMQRFNEVFLSVIR